MSSRSHRLAAAVLTVGLVSATIVGFPRASVAGASGDRAAWSADGWDPRVADIAAEVERLRGLEFDRPVTVKVLDSEAFDRRYTKEQKPTARARKEWAESQAALTALGLLDEPVDLETIAGGVGAQVLGYYDPERRAIVVRGDTFGSAATRATLAHELTHALQDQEFDLDRMSGREEKAGTGSVTALVEGDATRIGQRYEDALSSAEQADIRASNDATVEGAPDLPPFLSVSLSARYALGLAMAMTLDAVGGNRSVDATFREPPLNDLVVVDPTALVDRTAAKPVRAPKLEPGDQRLGDATPMGALLLYFVLASRLPAADALRVAERWGGDASVAFTRNGAQCVISAMVGRAEGPDAAKQDAATLADGLRRWSAAAGAQATVTERGDAVRLTSCAPSTPLEVSEASLNQAFFHLFLRNTLTANVIEAGQTAPAANCFADAILALDPVRNGIASLQAIDDEPPPGFDIAVQSAIAANADRLRSRCQNAV